MLAFALPILHAPPARACSCDQVRLGEAVAAGNPIAIVRRLDPPNQLSYVVQVERATATGLPARIEIEEKDLCVFDLPVHGIGALALERRGASWRMVHCSSIEVADGLQHVTGAPATSGTGPPVVLAVGGFAGARLAGLDRTGDVVAWDRRPGFGLAVAPCPGGERVAAIGFTTENHMELSVHDARTLDVVRTVALPAVGTQDVALACRDEAGNRVDLVAARGTAEGEAPGQWVSIRGTDTTARDLPGLGGTAATADGFVVTVVSKAPPVLVRLDAVGDQKVLHRFSDEPGQAGRSEFRVRPGSVAVSRDGRTIAVVESDNDTGFQSLLAIDSRSGELIRRQDLFSGGSLAWTRSGRLIFSQGGAPSERRVIELNADLRPVAHRSTVGAGGHLAAIGDDVVTYGVGRLAVHPALGRGQAREASELRLVGARQVIDLPALGDQAFLLSPDQVSVPDPARPVAAPVRRSTDGLTTTVGIGVVLVGAAAVLGTATARARRRHS